MPKGSAIACKAEKCASSSASAAWMVSTGRAGQFELAAGFKRNGAAFLGIIKADDIRPVHDRLPSLAFLHPFEKRPNAGLTLLRAAFVRNRRMIWLIKREFLVPQLPTRKGPCGFDPASNQATSSSRDVMGVASETSRAISELSFVL